MTTKAMLQKENDALRERVAELENPLARQTQTTLALPEKGLVLDLTERKQAEAALRESEEKHRLISEMISDYLYAGLVYPNGQAETDWMIGAVQAITGYNEAELKTLPFGFASLVNPEDLAFVVTQQPKLWAGESMVVEYRITTKSGEERWLRDYMRPLQDETLAPAIRLLGAVQDITERKRTEAALNESEAKYRLLVETANEGIWAMDQEHRTTYVNQAMAAMLGYAPIEILGKKVEDFFFAEDMGFHNERMSKRHAGQDEVYERRFKRRNGSELWTLVSARVIKDSQGDFSGSFAMFTDITERKRTEEALRKSEALLAEAQRIGQIGHWEWTASERKIVGSDELLRILGLPEDSGPIFLESIKDMVSPAEQERLFQLDQKIFANHGHLEYEFCINRPDGQLGWLHQQARVTYAEDGRPVRMIGVIQDITERKLTDTRLQASTERFNALFLNAPLQAVIYRFMRDPQGQIIDWEISDINPLGAASLSQPADALIGQHASVLLGPEVFGPYLELSRQVAATGQTHLFETHFETNGRDYLSSVFMVGADHYANISVDITERKQAEAALRESEERFRLFIDNNPTIAWIQDDQSRYVYLNRTYEKRFGVELEAWQGKTIFEVWSPEEAQQLWQNDQKVLAADRLLEFTEEIPNLDGSPGTWWSFKFPLQDASGQRYVGGIALDITERQQMEVEQAKLKEQLHQAQKMESIGRLAGGVAHDFNNLLTVIIGYADLMQAELAPDDPQGEKLEQVLQAAERAEGLTRQLLAFSRKQILAPVVLDLNELVENLHKMLDRLIGDDITLVTVLQPGLYFIKADPGQIEQVVMNLAVNARDAMPTGGRLTLETANVQLERLNVPGVSLVVTDSGHGMDESILAHIFEPFFTTKAQGKGTGLGLATVYGIVKQSGGEITVESQPGQGSTFKIYLPAHKSDVTRSTSPQPQRAVSRGDETIMLVEDNPLVRNLVRVALRNYGYTLLEAERGPQALALAEQQGGGIDLLLTDVIMPEMSGREVAERLQALHPHLKVLYMSGYTDDEVIQYGLLTDEVDFISKPFSPNFLAAKVRDILDE